MYILSGYLFWNNFSYDIKNNISVKRSWDQVRVVFLLCVSVNYHLITQLWTIQSMVHILLKKHTYLIKLTSTFSGLMIILKVNHGLLWRESRQRADGLKLRWGRSDHSLDASSQTIWFDPYASMSRCYLKRWDYHIS